MAGEVTLKDVQLQERGYDAQETFVKPGNKTEKKSNLRIWQMLVVVLSIVCLALLITVIVLAKKGDKQQENGHKESQVSTCSGQAGVIDLSLPSEPSVFSELTSVEAKALADFIYNNKALNLKRPDEKEVSANYVFLAELHLPNKKDVVAYLDGDTVQKPGREAKVVVFRGNQSTPDIQEIIVSPLPAPTQYRVLRDKISFNFRPFTGPDLFEIYKLIVTETITQVPNILLESYGGTISYICGDRCLSFYSVTPVSSAVSGQDKRQMWMVLAQKAEFFILHPVDFAVLVETDGLVYNIVNVTYNGQYADSLATLRQQYDSGVIKKHKIPFPNNDDTLFSKMTRRGKAFPSSGQRPPLQVEPDGKRYSIRARQVEYMNWRFDFRMSTSHGPQVYDIRYQGKRIVYELGLQELSVFYSGYQPDQMFANFFDSANVLGASSKSLVPGVDCPAHATFIPASHLLEVSEELVTFENTFCVFEQDTGVPLRRHHTYSKAYGPFYEGMPSPVLILRAIVTVVNYDYIIDFVFYQNGAIESKVIATGYILATPYTENDKQYGTHVHTYINGNLHHHIFNFKADLDVNGMKNRYDTMDITSVEVPNAFNPNPNAKMAQGQFTRRGKLWEKEAAYKFNFDTPKYHIFYNNSTNDEYGNPKAYRVLMKGMSKQILPEGKGNEPAASWMRYQMAVTKHNDNERSSGSIYSMFDAKNPVVNFQSYIDNNETIVDEDLVAWISMGVQHIPHTEDLPVTHTPGMDLSFFLLPNNYFPEDPSMASLDSIRIEPKQATDPDAGVSFTRHSEPNDLTCLPKKNKYQEMLQKNPTVLFEY